eukprot:SAG25_NODE_37_length_19691_cov_19.319467_6_plen_447_part_00
MAVGRVWTPPARVALAGPCGARSAVTLNSTASAMESSEEGVPPELATRYAAMERELAAARAEIRGLKSELAAVPPPPTLLVPTDAAREFGAPLGQILNAFADAKIAVVSTPEYGLGATPGKFDAPVMAAIENAASFCFPTLVAGYDFKGSASHQDCFSKQPDCEMVGKREHEWADPSKIVLTQWCRYWSGRVRATLSALVCAATALPSRVFTQSCDLFPSGQQMSYGHGAGSRIVFAFSITGGPVTQTEYGLLGNLIDTTVADLSTRELDLGTVWILWVHVETIDECLKALQGYGGIDVTQIHQNRCFCRPGKWTDGPYNEAFDLLKGVPGATPDDRRAYLTQLHAPDPTKLGMRLHNAIQSGSCERVQTLLAAKADPNFVNSGGFTALQGASARADDSVIRALLKAGAKRTANELHYATSCLAVYDGIEDEVVRRRIDATIALLS